MNLETDIHAYLYEDEIAFYYRLDRHAIFPQDGVPEERVKAAMKRFEAEHRWDGKRWVTVEG